MRGRWKQCGVALAAMAMAAAGVCAQAPAAPLPAPDKDGWISLFNGTDLTLERAIELPEQEEIGVYEYVYEQERD